ncbi:MAG: 2-oxoglutarate and iron-dependent oxygenase domain-containing protein [Pseudomonadota bacterium]
MADTVQSDIGNTSNLHEIPVVDWSDLESNREKFLKDLRYALSECGFLVLANAPGLDDNFQQRAFREVRNFFDSPEEVKMTSYIADTPYFRGYSMPRPRKEFAQKIETYQYSFDQEPLGAYDDKSLPLYKRLIIGPNNWPTPDAVPGFRPVIEELNSTYHRLTHALGELIVESLGEDPAEFREYFDLEEPYLAASLNHNFSLDAFDEDGQRNAHAEYQKFDSKKVGAHIDGPPFIALLINDRPGLQVVAGEGDWMNAPVTCRTAKGEYEVPVIPGSVIVNTGGTLMHLSEGRYSATLHRVNTTMIPRGDTRVSMPYFLVPKMEGDLVPFGKTEVSSTGTSGYQAGRDRGANTCANRMSTFPHVTERWWQDEFESLIEEQQKETDAETGAAYKLAAERGDRFKRRSTES